MKESVNWITVLKYAGAFVAFMIDLDLQQDKK